MDELLLECGREACNVEFFFGYDGAGDALFGVRLRPYGKSAPKDRMVLGGGYTAEEALTVAVGKARQGRWELLDWAARPWEVKQRGEGAWSTSR